MTRFILRERSRLFSPGSPSRPARNRGRRRCSSSATRPREERHERPTRLGRSDPCRPLRPDEDQSRKSRVGRPKQSHLSDGRPMGQNPRRRSVRRLRADPNGTQRRRASRRSPAGSAAVLPGVGDEELQGEIDNPLTKKKEVVHCATAGISAHKYVNDAREKRLTPILLAPIPHCPQKQVEKAATWRRADTSSGPRRSPKRRRLIS